MNNPGIASDIPPHVAKYLKKHSSGSWKLELSSAKKFKMAVVVPALMEYDNIKRLLLSLAKNNPALFDECVVIFVINNTANTKTEAKQDNLKSIEIIRKILQRNIDDEFISTIVDSGLQVGLVDASTEGNELNERNGGVGLARKIGMDLSLTIFNYADQSCKNILVCLDADCVVDENYLHEVYHSFQINNYSGAYIKFRHKIYGDELVHQAMTCYEIYMRYYVLGLKIAGSPYAFHTVGSTLACDAESYIKIGGMNKKKGGEDFYFMEKLAKIGKIGYIDTTIVYPAGRHSWRVPFGTGPRVRRFSEQTHDEYFLYSFKSFLLLKEWLQLFNSDEILNAEEYLETAGEIDRSIRIFLEKNSFREEWAKICKNSKTDAQINKQKLLWFDGFRTLKFIHFLRDNNFPDKNMFDVLDETFQYIDIKFQITREAGSIPNIDDQLKYLQILRGIA